MADLYRMNPSEEPKFALLDHPIARIGATHPHPSGLGLIGASIHGNWGGLVGAKTNSEWGVARAQGRDVFGERQLRLIGLWEERAWKGLCREQKRGLDQRLNQERTC